MSSGVESVIQYVKEKGINLTPQRKVIVETFIKNNEKHLSASDIYYLLKKENKSPGLATIYRTLDLLEKEGVVVRRDFDSETARYEFVINQGRHDHLICKKCGKVMELTDLLPVNIKKVLWEKADFYCEDYSLKFYGYCKDCLDFKCQEGGI